MHNICKKDQQIHARTIHATIWYLLSVLCMPSFPFIVPKESLFSMAWGNYHKRCVPQIFFFFKSIAAQGVRNEFVIIKDLSYWQYKKLSPEQLLTLMQQWTYLLFSSMHLLHNPVTKDINSSWLLQLSTHVLKCKIGLLLKCKVTSITYTKDFQSGCGI